MPTPLPVIANTYRCALKWTESSSGQTAVNVIHMQANGSGTTATDCYNAMNGAVTAAMWDNAVLSASIGEVDITPLDGHSGTITFVTGSPAKWSGSAGGDWIPAVATLIKLSTPLRGRANRGRVFLPFTAEAIQANGLITTSGVTAITNAWVAFQTALVALSPTEWGLVVASYDRAHSGAGAHATGINAVQCERPTASQRRRQERLR